jgi:hypothetical protein
MGFVGGGGAWYGKYREREREREPGTETSNLGARPRRSPCAVRHHHHAPRGPIGPTTPVHTIGLAGLAVMSYELWAIGGYRL